MRKFKKDRAISFILFIAVFLSCSNFTYADELTRNDKIQIDENLKIERALNSIDDKEKAEEIYKIMTTPIYVTEGEKLSINYDEEKVSESIIELSKLNSAELENRMAKMIKEMIDRVESDNNSYILSSGAELVEEYLPEELESIKQYSRIVTQAYPTDGSKKASHAWVLKDVLGVPLYGGELTIYWTVEQQKIKSKRHTFGYYANSLFWTYEKWKTTKNIYQNQKTRATIDITATYVHRNTGKLGFLKAGGWVKNDGDYYFYMID